jgi:hypothetical protein
MFGRADFWQGFDDNKYLKVITNRNRKRFVLIEKKVCTPRSAILMPAFQGSKNYGDHNMLTMCVTIVCPT